MKKNNIQKFRSTIRTFEQLRAEQVRLSTSCIGVSSARCHTLLALDELKSCSLNILAEKLCLEKSTVSRTVESLVQSGMVNRMDNPENRRESQLSLTPKGIDMVNTINADNNRIFGEVLAGMPRSDTKTLLKVFTSFTDAFKFKLEVMKENRSGATAMSSDNHSESVMKRKGKQ